MGKIQENSNLPVGRETWRKAMDSSREETIYFANIVDYSLPGNHFPDKWLDHE
ncbi:hypothetical protein DSO57_1006352 [Entomophthora muscae]|uniref:Uncharacterized protein n=1 Tax=Entomophthora muscae TaxID=34485 RepID=A0ACC2U5W7_9FUNG|nr:hypothetical protein DSO57_1006352 [Entomophthora muscae]